MGGEGFAAFRPHQLEALDRAASDAAAAAQAADERATLARAVADLTTAAAATERTQAAALRALAECRSEIVHTATLLARKALDGITDYELYEKLISAAADQHRRVEDIILSVHEGWKRAESAAIGALTDVYENDEPQSTDDVDLNSPF